MTFSSTIAKYKLIYLGKRSNDTKPIAYIYLYNSSNQRFGFVYFYRDGLTLSDNDFLGVALPKTVTLRMHECQIDSVVDMLRNEKPCSVHYSSPTYAYLYTGAEPVGEEES